MSELWMNSQIPSEGVQVGQPYQLLLRNKKVLNSYIELNIKNIWNSNNEFFKKELDELYSLTYNYGRKPNICFFGHYDSGKSTLANALLGSDFLPARLAPLTIIPTFVVHISDKKHWMNENVYIYKGNWNPILWEDYAHHKNHFLDSGDYSVLEKYIDPNLI